MGKNGKQFLPIIVWLRGYAPRVSGKHGQTVFECQGAFVHTGLLAEWLLRSQPCLECQRGSPTHKNIEMLGFLLGIPELQICSFILHNVAFCLNGRFKKHMKQLNEYVSCPHQATRRCAAFYPFYVSKSTVCQSSCLGRS